MVIILIFTGEWYNLFIFVITSDQYQIINFENLFWYNFELAY